jgi:polynucleotide 5'-hydroxyl-kinase GRC3/NOL9
VDPTHSLTSLRMLDSWSSTLAFFDPPISRANSMEEDGEEEEVGSSRTVLIVEGPKRVGKSTFAKLLLNRLLSR